LKLLIAAHGNQQLPQEPHSATSAPVFRTFTVN